MHCTKQTQGLSRLALHVADTRTSLAALYYTKQTQGLPPHWPLTALLPASPLSSRADALFRIKQTQGLCRLVLPTQGSDKGFYLNEVITDRDPVILPTGIRPSSTKWSDLPRTDLDSSGSRT